MAAGMTLPMLIHAPSGSLCLTSSRHLAQYLQAPGLSGHSTLIHLSVTSAHWAQDTVHIQASEILDSRPHST